MKPLFTLFFLSTTLSFFAQQTWEVCTTPNLVTGQSVVMWDSEKNIDGGLIYVGEKRNPSGEFITYTDAQGQILWTIDTGLISHPNDDYRDIAFIPLDSTYVLTGSAGGTPLKVNLLKISAQGDIIWQKTVNPTIDKRFGYETIYDDGHLILSGTANSSNDILVMKLDTAGNLIWENTYGFGHGYHITKTKDNHYLISGRNNIVLKIDTAGNQVWKKTYNDFVSLFTAPERQNRIVPTLDSQAVFIVRGDVGSGSFYNKQYLFKIDQQGDTVWTKNVLDNIITTISPSGLRYLDMAGTPDGGFIVSAYSPLVGSTMYGFLVKLDALGNLEWYNSYPNINDNYYPLFVHTLTQGGYMVFGSKNNASLFGSNIYIAGNLCVFKTDNYGNIYGSAVQGQIILDENQNCLVDSTEQTGKKNWIVKAEGGFESYAITNDSGYYHLRADTGNITLTFFPPNDLWGNCLTTIDTILTASDTLQLNNAVAPVANCPSMEVDLSAAFLRRCFTNNLVVNYCNSGVIPANNVEIEVTLDSFLVVNSSSIPWTTQNGQTYTFSLGTIPEDSCGYFFINATVDCAAPLGYIHCNTAKIFPDTICVSTMEDLTVSNFCLENRGSYDPNDKRGFPETPGFYDLINDSTKLTYHIRFQNTGTDTAFTVVIKDIIQTDILDLTTIRPTAASHPYTMTIEGSNILVFTFNNILLPDSTTNEPESHGFIEFDINQLPNNPPGTFLNNFAAIYFDFNEPIFTNTTRHYISNVDLVANQTVSCDSVTADIQLINGSGNYQYEWSMNATFDTIISQSNTLTFTENGTYYYCGKDGIAIIQDSVVINLPNYDGWELVGDNFLCEGDSTTLTLSSNFDISDSTFYWYLDDTLLNHHGSSITATQQGYYWVTTDTTNSCYFIDTNYVMVQDTPKPFIIDPNDSLVVIGNYSNYQWWTSNDFNGSWQLLPNDTSSYILYQFNTWYLVEVTDSLGCKGSSIGGIWINTETVEKMPFVVYPNPSSGHFQLTADFTDFQIDVFNLIGQRVYHLDNQEQTTITLDLGHLGNGTYTVVLYKDNRQYRKRVIVVR